MKIRFLDPAQNKYIQETINNDAEFRLAAKFMSKDILICADQSQCIIKIREGLITEMMFSPTPMDQWDFFIKGSEKSWLLFLQPFPPPFFHSFFGAAIREDFQFGGNIEALFAHYWAVQRMLACMRQLQNEKKEQKC